MSKILFITGPPGAGKSTTCTAFAANSNETWAFVEQDEIRKLVKAGFADPSEPWTKGTDNQWDASIDICADIARVYKRRGINLILECFAPPYSFEKWEKAFQGLEYKIIILQPAIGVAIQRNAQRRGAAKLREEQVKEHHLWFEGWKGRTEATCIDTSTLSLEEAVEAISAI